MSSVPFLFPPLDVYKKWIVHDSPWETKLNRYQLSFVLAQIFRPPFPQETHLTRTLTLRFSLWEKIQNGFQENIEIEKINIFVAAFLENNTLDSSSFSFLHKKSEKIIKEVNASYTILAFPYQETRFRENKNETIICECEERLIEGISILKKATGSQIELSIESIYLLHLLFFSRIALFEKGNPVSWHQLYSNWSSQYQLANCSLKAVFPKNLPQPTITPSTSVVSQWISFENYLIDKSVSSIESHYETTFSENVKSHLKEAFKDERTREDVIYWIQHPKDLERLSPSNTRLSYQILCSFRLLNRYIERFQMSIENRSYLFELILERDPGLEKNPKFITFPLENSDISTPLEVILGKIQEHALLRLEIQKDSLSGVESSPLSNLFYLVGLFIQKPYLLDLLPQCRKMNSSETIYFFFYGANPPHRS